MESKELPEDVLEIIRQYSKPAFVYFREYNKVLDLFDLSSDYKKKLKTKIEDPAIREQIKLCVEAYQAYHQKNAIFEANKGRVTQDNRDISQWKASTSLDKLLALLDEKEYRMKGFAAWYFQDDIDDAWMSDPDDEMTEEEDRLACLRQDEEMDRRYMRMENKETRMMEGEDRRGIHECYDGLDGLVRLGRLGSAPTDVE
jgi:hypothetical protein